MKTAHDELEEKVRARTEELLKANEILQEEIVERKRAWERLKMKERELRNKTTELGETNVALNILLKKREQDKEELGARVLSNLKTMVKPSLERLKSSGLSQRQVVLMGLIESGLDNIVSSFSVQLSSKYLCLTPAELQVAYLVKEGKRTKEIAELLNLSSKTIEDYRKGLRGKLGIKNMKVNLRTHLLTMSK